MAFEHMLIHDDLVANFPQGDTTGALKDGLAGANAPPANVAQTVKDNKNAPGTYSFGTPPITFDTPPLNATCSTSPSSLDSRIALDDPGANFVGSAFYATY